MRFSHHSFRKPDSADGQDPDSVPNPGNPEKIRPATRWRAPVAIASNRRFPTLTERRTRLIDPSAAMAPGAYRRVEGNRDIHQPETLRLSKSLA
jgi:hypothetical protein